MTDNKNIVAVVVPMYRCVLSAEEETSLRHLTHFLCDYDKYIIAPESLQINYRGFKIKKFGDRCFTSISAYNKLMLSRRFYESFINYKYVLIYQLDSLVFSDQLHDWCQTNLDYIGAPWPKDFNDPKRGFARVGNGGFSLRKVESFLKVLNLPGQVIDPELYWKNYCASRSKYVQGLNLPRKFLKRLAVFNDIRWYSLRPTDAEDIFWSYKAQKLYPEFAIATIEEGLRFAFEVAPEYCFAQNDYRLPFGCHAWGKWDKAFWLPYLLR